MTISSHVFWTYRLLIDPLTRGLRREISKQINPDSQILDIACGTGTLLFKLAVNNKCVGIDLDKDKIKKAKDLAKKRGLSNVDFIEADAGKLSNLFTYKFDYVVLSLAIHQFPEPLRSEIIMQAMKVGKQLILADYTVPVPRNYSGTLARSIERIAGDEHFLAYKSFVKESGLPGIIKKFNLECFSERQTGSGAFTVMKVKPI